MSDDHKGEPGDERLFDLLGAAMTEDGELLPITEAEVARLEDEQDEVELPERLRTLRFDDGGAEVTELEDYKASREEVRKRTSPWTHVVAMAVSAAATLAIRAQLDTPAAPDLPLSSDPAGVPTVSAPTPDKKIVLETSCTDCCGGNACAQAKPGLERCSSGRQCIACDPAVLADTRYRVRVGAVTPGDLGQRVLAKYPQGEPELCVRAGLSQEICIPTHISEREGGRWTTLPAVFSGDDLAAKVAVRVRWKGVTGALATAGQWTMPVAVTPKSLCSGYNVELLGEKDEVFGTLSMFVDDAHFVEIERAAGTAVLRDRRKQLVLKGLGVQLFETRGEGDAKFVLTAGPFNRRVAESLRVQLLDQDVPAATKTGLDYVGEPLPLP